MKCRNKLTQDKLYLYDYFKYPNLIQSLNLRSQGDVVLLEDNDAAMLFWGLSIFIGGNFSIANGKEVVSVLKNFKSPRYVYVPDNKWSSFIKRELAGREIEKDINFYQFDNTKKITLNQDEHIVPVTRSFMEEMIPNTKCIVDELYSYTSLDDFLQNGVGVALVIDGKVAGFCLSEYSFNNSLGANIWIDEKYHGLGYAKKLTNAFLWCCQEKNKEVYWVCNDDNIRSNRVARSTGFVLKDTGCFLEI